jgi:ferric iron reductase protein FhuF
MAEPDLGAALRRAAEIGPFFELVVADGADWQPFADLIRDPAVLRARISAIRTALAASTRQDPESIEWRVAASLAQLNIAARLVSPLLGAAVVAGVLPVVSLESLRWQPKLGGPFPLAIRGGNALQLARGTPAMAAARLRSALAPILGELVDATHQVGGLAVQISWGNIDSAVATALRLIAEATASAPGPAVRRSTCCLFYRVAPDAGLCADCVLSTRPVR